VGFRWLAVSASLVGLLGWAATGKPVQLSRRAALLYHKARSGLERRAIRWSGELLRDSGAVESGQRAEQEALLAHRVAEAVRERLGNGVLELRVVVIGGVVHLEGRVSDPGARAVAEETARRISGARVVADDLHAPQ